MQKIHILKAEYITIILPFLYSKKDLYTIIDCCCVSTSYGEWEHNYNLFNYWTDALCSVPRLWIRSAEICGGGERRYENGKTTNLFN